ncbi:MAG: RAQPRD family integrative conjugative element protein [Pirellulaceae bacterium]
MRTGTLAAGFFGTLLLTTPLFADVDAERESLARLVHELDALEPLLRTAEAQADPDARIRFQYAWLRQDIARIRLGIEEHLNAPQAEPRRFPPITGDYRR